MVELILLPLWCLAPVRVASGRRGWAWPAHQDLAYNSRSALGQWRMKVALPDSCASSGPWSCRRGRDSLAELLDVRHWWPTASPPGCLDPDRACTLMTWLPITGHQTTKRPFSTWKRLPKMLPVASIWRAAWPYLLCGSNPPYRKCNKRFFYNLIKCGEANWFVVYR